MSSVAPLVTKLKEILEGLSIDSPEAMSGRPVYTEGQDWNAEANGYVWELSVDNSSTLDYMNAYVQTDTFLCEFLVGSASNQRARRRAFARAFRDAAVNELEKRENATLGGLTTNVNVGGSVVTLELDNTDRWIAARVTVTTQRVIEYP